MESGNFDGMPVTLYDKRLDQASDKPGAQWLEKMVVRQYVGELVRLVTWDLAQRGLIFAGRAAIAAAMARG